MKSSFVFRRSGLALLLSVLFLISSFVIFIFPGGNVSAVRTEPTRVINVVYDDSGSMYKDSGNSIDRWSKALYSLEVFAAMLGENDTMNVYFMSSFDDGNTVRFEPDDNVSSMPGAAYVLRGSDGAANNVSRVHNYRSNGGNTPFASVNKALADLSSPNVVADEKWLVVLTDGEFEDGRITQEEVNSYVYAKPSNINVVCLALATGSMNLPTPSDADHIYVDQVSSSDSILGKITEVITRVFNSTKLSGVSGGSVSFNLPMSELIVFAQGENAQLSGQISNGNDTYNSVNDPIVVRHTDSVNITSPNHQNNQPDTTLNGQIAIFRGAFDAGTYNLGVTGAADGDVAVFYKPDVEVTLKLTDPTTGEEIVLDSTIEPGTYNYDFVFVRTGTDEVCEDTSLLGNVDYTITLDGAEIDPSNHTIEFEDGTHNLIVTADFLTYNHVERNISLNVVTYVPPTDTPTPTPETEVIPVTFRVVSNTNYKVSTSSFENTEPIVVHAMLDGREFTSAEWAIMNIPEISLNSDAKHLGISDISIEKSDEIGDFIVTITLPNSPKFTTYDKLGFSITYSQEIDQWTTWAGESSGDETYISFEDTRPPAWRYLPWIISLLVLLAILILIFLYTPMVKHYLPKMSKSPQIQCENVRTHHEFVDQASVKIDLVSTLLPLVPQKATLTYLPGGAAVPFAEDLEVVAEKNGVMKVVNAEAFRKDECPVLFNGATLNNSGTIRAGTTVFTKYHDLEYTVQFNH